MNHILRIGSRKSVLALRQAEMIAEQLKNKFPGLQTEILTRDTLGAVSYTHLLYENPA